MSGESESLQSPLLYGQQAEYTTGDHAIVDSGSLGTEAKFGEYVSRAKARSNNSLRLCGLPFNGFMLVCIMFLTFGSYWSYDVPGSIETQLTAWFGDGYSHASNSLLYSIYSWPNCILPFFGGFILDKITGVRRGAVIFCGMIALGQLIFALGCQWKIYWLAFAGRFVFGLGGENLTVAQNTYVVRWFDGKRLALAFGLVVAFSRIGTSVNFVVSPILANSPITYEQHFSAIGATSCANEISALELSGRINKCSAGRLVDCDEMKTGEMMPGLILFPAGDATCQFTNTSVSQDIAPSVCFKPIFPLNGTFASAKIELDAATNEYFFQAWSKAGCEGPAQEAQYGLGNGCHNGTFAGLASYRVAQDITAPCYVAQYAPNDQECNGAEINRFGMKRDTCVVPMNPNSPPYQFSINPGTGVPLTVWFAMGMCTMSFIACIIASACDYWGESKVEADRQTFLSTLSTEEAAYVRKLDDMNEPTSDDISFKMILKVPATAWLLFFITATFYIAILNFYQVASDILQNTGNKISDVEAGLYIAIPNFVAIVASPTGGYMVDKLGRALVLIATSCAMLICAHFYFLALAYGWLNASPIPAMLWLGVTYSLGASCLWPILAFIVEKDALGTAYGCMTSVQNLFLALAALVIGQLQDWAKTAHPGVLEYTLPIMGFMGCATIALVCTLFLICLDARRGGKLNASASERAARLAAEEAEQEAKNQASSGRGAASPSADASLNKTTE